MDQSPGEIKISLLHAALREMKSLEGAIGWVRDGRMCLLLVFFAGGRAVFSSKGAI